MALDVLIVDDSAAIRKILIRMLSQADLTLGKIHEANDGEEAMHVFAQKGQAETKFWLHADQYVVEEDFEHNLTPRGRREIRKLVYLHFDEIATAWYDSFGGRRAF